MTHSMERLASWLPCSTAALLVPITAMEWLPMGTILALVTEFLEQNAP